ncbi:MAG TPA: hypothetical protein VI758_01035 [Bacteroidota bacterium]
MRCPFLREVQVKSCSASPFKKMIVRSSIEADHERCSGTEWMWCPAAKGHREDHPNLNHCPFLHESLVQYCSAVPAPTFVPYNESPSSRCHREGHVYCELFLSTTYPEYCNPGKPVAADLPPEPANVFFSPNHMWIRMHDDGSCHIGVDSLLAKVLKRVETLSFAGATGDGHPAALFSVRGITLRIVFPAKIDQIAAHTYLRLRPEYLASFPYTLGWLFEGMVPRSASNKGSTTLHDGWVSPDNAGNWMSQESRRLIDYVHSRVAPAEIFSMTDGGVLKEDLIAELTPEELYRLFDDFFSHPRLH